jgi:hypothetical protein
MIDAYLLENPNPAMLGHRVRRPPRSVAVLNRGRLHIRRPFVAQIRRHACSPLFLVGGGLPVSAVPIALRLQADDNARPGSVAWSEVIVPSTAFELSS